MTNREVANGRRFIPYRNGMGGYSLIEILVVMALVAVMTAISLPYLFSSSRKFASEDQAIKVMDLMREAGQLALTRRRNITFEINGTITDRPVVQLIDDVTDQVIKTVPLEPRSRVRMDAAPAGFTTPNPPNYAAAVYASNVWAVNFTSSGTVVTIGATPVPVSATLYSWRPIMEPGTPFNPSNLTPARREEVRAVTIFGGSGAVRYWRFTGTAWAVGQ